MRRCGGIEAGKWQITDSDQESEAATLSGTHAHPALVSRCQTNQNYLFSKFGMYTIYSKLIR